MATKLIQTGAAPAAAPVDVSVIKEALPAITYPEFAGGASGNGLDDDWPAFEAAFAGSLNRGWHGRVPPGHYRMTDGGVPKTLIVGQGTHLEGAGALMTHQVNSGIDMPYNSPTLLDWSGGVAVDGIATPLDAAQVYRAHAPEIRTLTMKGSGRANGKSGILWRENTLLSTAVVPRRLPGMPIAMDLSIEGFGIGMNAANADGCNWERVSVWNCGYGYKDSGAIEIKMDRCVFWDLDTAAIDTTSSKGHINGCEVDPALMAGGTPTAAGIILRGPQVSVEGNIINACTVGVDIRSDGCRVIGNDIGDLGSAAIVTDAITIGQLDGLISPTGNVIADNTIINWGTGGTNRAAIRGYGGMNGGIIALNKARSPAGNGSRGIVAGDGSNGASPADLTVIGNKVPATLALPYSFTGTGHTVLANTPNTRAAVASPAGGVTVDAEARAAIDAIRAALAAGGVTL